MRTVEQGHAAASLDEYLTKSRGRTLVVTRRGKPVAALLPIEDADWETVALSTNPRFIRMIQRSRTRQAAKGGIPLEEARRRLIK
jgi:prevent-host-death family protein